LSYQIKKFTVKARARIGKSLAQSKLDSDLICTNSIRTRVWLDRQLSQGEPIKAWARLGLVTPPVSANLVIRR